MVLLVGVEVMMAVYYFLSYRFFAAYEFHAQHMRVAIVFPLICLVLDYLAARAIFRTRCWSVRSTASVSDSFCRGLRFRRDRRPRRFTERVYATFERKDALFGRNGRVPPPLDGFLRTSFLKGAFISWFSNCCTPVRFFNGNVTGKPRRRALLIGKYVVTLLNIPIT